jgi:IS66 Orf2 like protein
VILGVPSRPGLRIVVAAKPVDFRKGMDSLAALVMQALSSDPFAGDVFIFRSKRSDRLKLLVWDGSGLGVSCPTFPPSVKMMSCDSAIAALPRFRHHRFG